MSVEPLSTVLDVDYEPGSDSPAGAYRSLWAAVFACAISDLASEVYKRMREKPPRRGLTFLSGEAACKLPFYRAENCPTWLWVMSPLDGVGSFLGLCVMFDLNPEAVRQHLRNRFFE